MVWKPIQLRRVVDFLKPYFSLDLFPKFTRYTVQYIGSFMGRAVRCHREIATKRLHRRNTRKLNQDRQKSKVTSSKCVCSKCTGFRFVQKKRVIEPDFLANLAYNQRVLKDKETSVDEGYNEEVGEITLSAGETWWNKIVNQHRSMPPLYRGPLDKPTKSEHSSATSGFRSATPDIFSEAIEPSRSVTPLSVNTGKSCTEDMPRLSNTGEESKSDSKIMSCKDKSYSVGAHTTTRSASINAMPLGISPKEGRSSSLPLKRHSDDKKKKSKKKKKRKTSIGTTSHGSDGFSTCVKCSRILSRAI